MSAEVMFSPIRALLSASKMLDTTLVLALFSCMTCTLALPTDQDSGLPASLLAPLIPDLDGALSPADLMAANPNIADADPPPTSATLPPRAVADPLPSGIPTMPAVCDPYNPSEECFSTLSSNFSTTGAKLVYDPDNSDYWMGPDYLDYTARISGNFARAADFLLDGSKSSEYITLTCSDPKDKCRKRIQGMSIGGYAWTYDGWFGYKYGYVNMCDPFFGLSNLSDKMDEINAYLKNGQLDQVRDMRYYKTLGQYMLHEMMHLRSSWYPEPKIYDQFVTDIPPDTIKIGPDDRKAYGPLEVHNLAKHGFGKWGQQGGSQKSSVNADSYAILASNVFWWDVNNIFPGIPDTKDTPSDGPPAELYMPFLQLDNSTNPSTVDFSALFDAELEKYSVNAQNPTGAVSQPSTPPAPPPPAQPEDKCGDKYNFFWDHFDIYGKNFDAAKFGQDGSGLKQQIKGCGAISGEWHHFKLVPEYCTWKPTLTMVTSLISAAFSPSVATKPILSNSALGLSVGSNSGEISNGQFYPSPPGALSIPALEFNELSLSNFQQRVVKLTCSFSRTNTTTTCQRLPSLVAWQQLPSRQAVQLSRWELDTLRWRGVSGPSESVQLSYDRRISTRLKQAAFADLWWKHFMVSCARINVIEMSLDCSESSRSSVHPFRPFAAFLSKVHSLSIGINPAPCSSSSSSAAAFRSKRDNNASEEEK
ncbi:hypothetical protein FH972_023115 [Carpinus fangiana]|uniref:Uncharacterized protein n=1 Tax=Carpinus fangiana TaxID=176857 RepID=A0A5N6KUQ9_9ROSI|nr:hypothetical protein FH972_023115 [Carpinus fangiana]